MSPFITLTQNGLKRSVLVADVLSVSEVSYGDNKQTQLSVYDSTYKQNHTMKVDETHDEVMTQLDGIYREANRSMIYG